MLGKLMKYELRATRRIFLPLYGLIIALAALNKLFMQLNFQQGGGAPAILTFITMAVYVILIAAAFVMTLIVTIQRFQKNLLGDEGYLSFTLPVKVHSHIDSKMIISLMWTVLSILVAALSIFLLVADRNTLWQIQQFFNEMGQIFQRYGGMAWLISIEFVVAVLISTLACILQIYGAMSVGNLCSKHKLLAGFGTFIGFGIVQEIVASIILQGSIGNPDDWSRFFDSFVRQGGNDWAALSAVASFLGIFLAFSLAFGAAFYFFTNWLLSRKLNLE